MNRAQVRRGLHAIAVLQVGVSLLLICQCFCRCSYLFFILSVDIMYREHRYQGAYLLPQALLYVGVYFVVTMNRKHGQAACDVAYLLHQRCKSWEFANRVVPAGSPALGGDVAFQVFWHKPTELAHPCLFCSCDYFCLYGPFNCISFHKFSRRLSVFLLCSSGLNSALLVLSIYVSLWKYPSALI